MRFEFIADRPVLDFLPTIAERGTTDLERLETDQDLSDWIVESGLVDEAPALRAGDLERVRELREALFRFVAALVDRRDPDVEDLSRVNAAAAVAPPRPWVDDAGLHRSGDLDAVESALARDALDLFDSPERELLHWCGDPKCTRPFVDRSHGRRRRWCGMKGCGDRAKAAAYRQRRRSAEVS